MGTKVDYIIIHILMVYSAVIVLYLHYCTEMWGNTYDFKIDKLIKLQNQGVIGSSKYRVSTSNLYHAFKGLKLQNIIKFKICTHILYSN